jgi:alkyl sulfatase BDS1-like metallo-beta-lactamase superfamily hydrolase
MGWARFLLGMVAGVVLSSLVVLFGVWAFGRVLAPMLAGTPSIPKAPQVAAAAATKAAMEEAAARVAADDKKDFEDADRGFVATLKDPVIKRADGQIAYDLSGYDFLKSVAPQTANPSLWRQAQILTKHGLFKVSDKIYQVRGFDVSTISFIDAGAGWIVVDPLTTNEVAAAAKRLVEEHVAKKPVLAVIYSHSHGDHYGGVLGVTTREDVQSGKTKIIAPEGFLHHAVSENIIAGPAMSRRARYQFGLTLPRGAEGEMTSGLGPALSRGNMSLVAPTDSIVKTGQAMTIGDVTLVFQITPGTEAPAEMNFHIPAMRALFMAENANLTMHNLLPARGALVRDAKAWADYLTESIRLFGDKSDVMFAAHGIPRFGQQRIVDFLNSHRDAYKFLHDQSVRLMNVGLTASEIAEVLKLPESLSKEWYNRGYYGTMSHNSKAIYQRYLGWYDANPANLWSLPPEDAAKKYVEAMGGADAVLTRAKAAVDAGEYRWAAMLLNQVVFAGGETKPARDMLAGVYTQLGYQAEAGTWRNIYLTGAQELREGALKLPPLSLSPDVLAATPADMLLDVVAVRINPEKALASPMRINLVLTDVNETHLITIRNGVMIHEKGVTEEKADATVRMTRFDMIVTMLAGVAPATRSIQSQGDGTLYGKLAGMIDPMEPNFNIVTP